VCVPQRSGVPDSRVYETSRLGAMAQDAEFLQARRVHGGPSWRVAAGEPARDLVLVGVLR